LSAGSGCSIVILLASFQQTRTTYGTPLLCVQWKTPDDGQRNCPKHVEFHSKNKFERLVNLVGFIVRNLSRCTVTWTSNICYLFVYILSRVVFAIGRKQVGLMTDSIVREQRLYPI
jgi:hypothetical protein